MIEQPTPRAIFDLYTSLSDEDKVAFLRLLGRTMSVQGFAVVFDSMPILLQLEWAARFQRQFIADVLPGLLLDAIRAGREYPQAEEPELAKLAQQKSAEFHEHIRALVEARVKQARDRKSDPEIVRRNVEICDLRKQDRQKWSLGMLGKKYDLTKQAIKKILEEEDKWRRLAGEG